MSALVLRAYVATVGRLGDARRGATAVEYGLILALVAGVCIAAMTAFSQANSEVYAKMDIIARIFH